MRSLAIGIASAIALCAQDQNSTPQYFDAPKFIVAGVADPTERGGHGSDPVLRSADALAKDTAALHTGGTDEQQGQALEAARKLQRAAELDPSEANLFDWGAELLKHRAADQAVEVFSNGHRRFPRSTRTLLGLAVSLYSRGSYDQAAMRFFEAADLDPNDPAPYLFLGKVSSGAILDLDGYSERMKRFARLHPENALANYYYAATLWKTKGQDDLATTRTVQALLEQAVRFDPHLGPAFLLLGIVFAGQGNVPKAVSAYQNAIVASPAREEPHYRLAQIYRKNGDVAKAKEEIELYQQLSRKSAENFERSRAEIQQFVFEMRH
jgi:tetratricopeptide (TPR) repeat protein